MINVFVLLTGLVVKIKGIQVTNPITSLCSIYYHCNCQLLYHDSMGNGEYIDNIVWKIPDLSDINHKYLFK